MTAAAARPLTGLADLLPPGLRIGEPDSAGALVLFPLLGTAGQASYVLLAAALARGAALLETDPPNVNRLRLLAPPSARVLLFAGEEVVGAKQNRIVNATVVVPAGSSLEIPVSCIEKGRWTLGGESRHFDTSTQVAYTSLRGTMSGMVRESRIRGRSYDTDQGGVWREVAKQTMRRRVQSATGAMTAIFDAEAPALETITRAARLRDGQLGILAFVAGRFLSLDVVSRPDAWRSLHARVTRGHALESLGVAATDSPALDDAVALLTRLSTLATTRTVAAVGTGVEIRADGDGLSGSGVLLDDELVQLSVFPSGA